MCFKDRKKPALFVTIFSVIVILCGAIMAVQSVIYVRQDDIASADVSDGLEGYKNISFGFLFAFSMLAFVTGIAGTTCACKPCAEGSICWPIMYGVPLFFVWLVTLILGGMITTVSVVGPEQIQGFCDGEAFEAGSNGEWLTQQIDTIDDAINSYSSHYMCSYECPCL